MTNANSTEIADFTELLLHKHVVVTIVFKALSNFQIPVGWTNNTGWAVLVNCYNF